ncbi:MAG TPA: hypothetical protein VFB82_24495, partial [Blastocatellia bacterium]|nr:hypothetical protein [Blastocatellia bacterium]
LGRVHVVIDDQHSAGQMSNRNWTNVFLPLGYGVGDRLGKRQADDKLATLAGTVALRLDPICIGQVQVKFFAGQVLAE